MFNNQQKRQEEMMKEQQQTEMDFHREQQGMAAGAQDDQTVLEMQQERTDLIRWQQDMSEELRTLVMKLKRYVKDEKGNWVPKMIMVDGKLKRIPAMCNDLFIEEVVEPNAEPYLSKGNTNSNLKEELILQNLRNTFNDIASTMANNDGRYGIFKYNQQDNVVRVLKNTLIPAAFRNMNGWTKKMDSTVFRAIEQSMTNPNTQEKKKGFAAMFN